MKRGLVMGGAMLLILLLVGSFLVLPRLVSRKTTNQPCAHPLMQPADVQFHMITPHLCSIPTFTIDDVRQYVNTHRFSDLRITSVGQPIATKMIFVTNYQLSLLLDESYSGPNPNSIMCYVELQGIFTFSSPFGRSAIIRSAFEVIDGLTGNVSESGG
jgi:hypothetical protein